MNFIKKSLHFEDRYTIGGDINMDINKLEVIKNEINEILAQEIAKEFAAMEGDDDCAGGACKI